MSETKLPAIPNSADPATKALKEALEVRLGRRGNPLDRALTLRDLYDAGVITVPGLPAKTTPNTSGLSAVVQDTLNYAVPPKPTSVLANGAFIGITINWDTPTRSDLSGHVYRSDTDDIATAVFIGAATASFYVDAVGPGQRYYYWVKFVSSAEVAGSFNDTAGALGETSVNVSDVMAQMNDAFDAETFRLVGANGNVSPFITITGAGTTVGADGTLYPNTEEAWQITNHVEGFWFAPGMYLDTLMLADASIDAAKIRNLAVDFASISGQLTANQIEAIQIEADQINVGALTGMTLIGSRIESGLAIMEDGQISGAYITGSTIEGGVLLSAIQAAVTQAGAPHYGYPLGVTDNKNIVSTSDSRAMLQIRPYNYYNTTVPNINNPQYASNYYRYRRQNICTIKPAGFMKFYWSGVPYFWRNHGDGVTTVNCFKIRASMYEGNTQIASYTKQYSFVSWWDGGHTEYFNISFNLGGFAFSGTASYSRGSHEDNCSGYYDHRAPAQWVTLSMVSPSTYNFDDANAYGIGFRLEILQSYAGHSSTTVNLSHEADNDY